MRKEKNPFLVFDLEAKSYNDISYYFRKVTFALCVDGEPFVKPIKGLDKAILAFLYICFAADMHYPQV
jgi:hypothetical protein